MLEGQVIDLTKCSEFTLEGKQLSFFQNGHYFKIPWATYNQVKSR